MKIGRLKELIKDIDDNVEIHIRNSVNPCGNISDLVQIEITNYQMFGTKFPCVILNTSDTSKRLQLDEHAEYIELVRD